MKLTGESLDYLYGKKFSNNLVIPYEYREPIPNRVSFLANLARDRSVIHLGCLDHLPLIDDKIRRGQWLHKELTESAGVCLGVDIDREAMNFVREKYGYSNMILGDFTVTALSEITRRKWDYAILGEILEHIDNPVSYLAAIRDNYASNIERIVVTVPNAWTQVTMRMARASRESINSDHRYWFTPYTLSKVMIRAGLEIEDLYFANRVPLTTRQLISAKMLRLIGVEPRYDFTFASSIIGIAKLRAS